MAGPSSNEQEAESISLSGEEQLNVIRVRFATGKQTSISSIEKRKKTLNFDGVSLGELMVLATNL